MSLLDYLRPGAGARAAEASPYREPAPRFTPEVQAEMNATVALLEKWRQHRATVAGGALWAWAANKQASDVDVFVKAGPEAHRIAKMAFGEPESRVLLDAEGKPIERSGYIANGEKDGKKSYRYRGLLPGTETKLDLVLVEWEPTTPYMYFDYMHAAVGFALVGQGSIYKSPAGVDAYVAGKLEPRGKPGDGWVRPEEKVLGKVQKSLWGKPEAKAALYDVFEYLEKAAGQSGVVAVSPPPPPPPPILPAQYPPDNISRSEQIARAWGAGIFKK